MDSHWRLRAIVLEAVSLWPARYALAHASPARHSVLFFGARFTTASMRHRGGAIRPKVAAVRIRTEILPGLESRL